MSVAPRNGIFLSYARKDGESFANALHQKLQICAPDLLIQQDRQLLEGGIGWWKQLTAAIDTVEYLILLMTPFSMQSAMVQKEWRYARQQGICVYPVKAASDSELNFDQLPRWMSRAHFFDIEREWDTFLAHLRKGCSKPRVPFMAPDLPGTFVQRLAEFNRLKNLLLSSDRNHPVAITTALSGAGGFGKTTLAAALCHDDDIIQNFDDGILWTTLGQNPNVLGSLVTVYAALTGERPGFVTEEDAAFNLGQKLEDRTCLLVIDDAWESKHLQPFLRGGKGCGRLFTTRNLQIASQARAVNVDEMRESESLALLSKGIPGLSTERSIQLSRKLGEWPIALELASAMMRQRVEQGDSAEHAADRLIQILNRSGPKALAINAVLESSLTLLTSDERQHLTELSIFPEDIAIPLSAAATLWQLDEIDSEETAQRFARLSLLKLDLGHGTLRLHDVMRRWLAEATRNASELHNRLITAWRDWMQLPNTYAWRWLSWHLAEAGRTNDLKDMLLDPAWLQAKLLATDVNALVRDFDRVTSIRELTLIQGAIRLSSNILANDPGQFTSQILGRLLLYNQYPTIQRFLEVLTTSERRPWLRPLRPALDPPGTGLVRTLVGHSFPVTNVALSLDGRIAISTSHDETLKVWDLETGVELRTLRGHSHRVNSIALSADGRRAVSASDDDTLKVWDLETGVESCTLVGHSDAVRGVALSSDGRWAVSASSDRTLKVWDLESGSEVRTLEGHLDAVNGVVLSSDGKRAVSASSDRTLKLWEMEAGVELRTLVGHAESVSSVGLSPDGRWAVSASYDRTLKVWDLEKGTEVRTLTGHSHRITSVALTLDGRRIVSASYDRTLKVWDRETGINLRTLAGHSYWVRGVALSADGRRAVSASFDKTLKVWDLKTSPELPMVAGHSSSVDCVALSPDRQNVLSASYDQTVKISELKSGIELQTLTGHAHGVTGVALSPNGLHIVTSSYDETVKLWDLKTGTVLRTFIGHSHGVTCVRLTPDGLCAVSASFDKTLKVWDIESGAEIRTMTGHTDSVTCVVISPDGKRVVSASYDGTLKLWDLTSGVELLTLVGHSGSVNGVSLDPDRQRVVSASADRTLKLWDLEQGIELRTLVGHSGSVLSAALTSDGRRVASTSSDQTLRVWDLNTGEAIATFSSDATLNCCIFVGNGAILAGDETGRTHHLLLELGDQS